MRGAVEPEFMDLTGISAEIGPDVEKIHTLQTQPRRRGADVEEVHQSHVVLQFLGLREWRRIPHHSLHIQA